MGSEVSVARERKRHGKHYTPPALARFLARRLLAQVPRRRESLRMLDPACGDGELLLAMHCEVVAVRPEIQLELVGYDLDGHGLAVARGRADAAGVGIDWHVGDFLAAAPDLADGAFDAIITNPPYVRTQQLGGATAQLLSQRYGLHGRIDLAHPFVAIAPRLLREGGVLGLLCSNRFLTTKAGANIRRLLLTDLAPVELYDLGDTKLFDAAVLPAVTIATRTFNRGPCRYVSAYAVAQGETGDGTDLFEALLGSSGCLVAHDGRTFAVEIGTLATDDPMESLRPRVQGDATAQAAHSAFARPLDALGPRRGMADNGDERRAVRSEAVELSSGDAGVAGLDINGDLRRVGRPDPAREPDGLRGASRSEAVGPAVLPSGVVDTADDPDTDGGRRSVGCAARGRGSGGPLSTGGTVAVGLLEAGAGGKKSSARVASALTPVAARRAWRMSRPGVDDWLGRIGAATWRTFGEVARIRVGIKTTADRVFISDRWPQVRPSPEPELLLDLITHHDVAAWRIDRTRDLRVLYPYDTTQPRRIPVDLGEFPCTEAYLRTHEETLSARRYVTAGGREWFEIWVPQRPHLWRVPKLVFPDISERPRFALDRSAAVVNGDCYWVSLADLAAVGAADHLAYLLMGVANSALGLRFYDAVCGNRLYAGRRRWITQYVSRLPLPDPASAAASAIIEVVRECADGAAAPDTDVARLLDERVAAAFGVPSGGGADADHRQQGAACGITSGGGIVDRGEPARGEGE